MLTMPCCRQVHEWCMQLRPQIWQAIAKDWQLPTPVRDVALIWHLKYSALADDEPFTEHGNSRHTGRGVFMANIQRGPHVEASPFSSGCARRADFGHRIKVLHCKVEELDLHGEKVDILISEPMGTLLVIERMLEPYLYARDHFLKPNGRMFPVRLKSFSQHVASSGLLPTGALLWPAVQAWNSGQGSSQFA